LGAEQTASLSRSPNASQAFVDAFFEELSRSGLRHVCVSPGSRSTPLAVAAARCSDLRCWSHVDERSAAFFALGLARASRSPVALVCTSGTAAANYLPAVAEAHYAAVPLLVLTADRPPELRDWGAGQTIDQLGLYGRHVRRFVEVPVPAPGAAMLRYARSLACRSVAEAAGPPAGAVHLNWPLREPLDPRPREQDRPIGEGDTLALAGRARCGAEARTEERSGDAAQGVAVPYVRVSVGRPALAAADRARLLALVRAHERGVILCGPTQHDAAAAAAVARFGVRAGWPVLADPTSQQRRGPACSDSTLIAHADLLLRDADFASAHPPDLVIRIGASPVSKAQRLWVEAASPEHFVLLDPDGGWNDPSHLASQVLRVDAAALCEELSEELCNEPSGDSSDAVSAVREGDWLGDFLAADARVGAAIAAELDEEPALFEPRAVRELAEALPDAALLYVSNSMPIRDLDAFLPSGPKALRVLANRGANGIDGVVSSALGAAAAGCGPVALLIGDLALLHDLGGLLAARRHALPLTLVVLNNDGGGIFSHLPIAEYGESVCYDELFRTPHGLDFASAAALFGLRHTRVENWAQYRAAIEGSLAGGAAALIEVPIDAAANLEHFRGLLRSASRALHEGAKS